MLNESHVEEAALEWLKELGWGIEHGPHIAPQEPKAERDSFSEVVLNGRLQDAIRRLNPEIPAEALEDAFKKVVRPVAGSASQITEGFTPCCGRGWKLSIEGKMVLPLGIG